MSYPGRKINAGILKNAEFFPHSAMGAGNSRPVVTEREVEIRRGLRFLKFVS